MVHRLAALLVALSIAFMVPPDGAGRSMSAILGGMAVADCACPAANPDCPDHDTSPCGNALACAVQCGATVPMLTLESASLAAAATGKSNLPGGAPPPAAGPATPPFRPPAISILA
jgi:hypothetical protein